jgi:hypothetical protein
MRSILLLGGLGFAVILTIYGLLMALGSKLFLKFHDLLNPGSRWNTCAAWRRNIRSTESRAAGVMLLLFGLVFGVLIVTKLFGAD